MGTSASSPGPGGNVPLVPPWVPPLPQPLPAAPPAPNPLPEERDPILPEGILPSIPPELNVNLPTQVAPPRRFGGTRGALGRFARTGSRGDLRHGLKQYVRSGMSGSTAGVRRMAGTARTAGALYDTLSGLQTGQVTAAELGVDPATLAGRPAKEILDIVLERIRPIDGTQDAEANRQSIAIATSDLLEQFPDADLASLGLEQIDFLIEHYVAYDICQRVELDVGKKIELEAPDAATAVSRLEEMKNYVVSEVQATFNARRSNGERLQRGQVGRFVASVLRDVLQIFEEYIQ